MSSIESGIDASKQIQHIGFTEFTSQLIRETYDAIVSGSIEQMKNYADFISTISAGLDSFLSKSASRIDHDVYIRELLDIQSESGPIGFSGDEKLKIKVSNHFDGITIGDDPLKTFDTVLNNAPVGKITRDDLISFIDNKVKRNSEKNFKALETLVKLGLQKIVVDTGSIESKLTFHINAIDSKNINTHDSSRSSHALDVSAGFKLGWFGAEANYKYNRLDVSVVNENISSAVNLNVDIIGRVKINFKTESFPIVTDRE